MQPSRNPTYHHFLSASAYNFSPSVVQSIQPMMTSGKGSAELSSIIKIVKSLSEIKQILREQSPYLAEEYGVRIVGLFGSYVRQQQRPDSDVDLLIELDRPPKISLIGLIELEGHLSQLLGVHVDIAIKTNLKKRIGARILHETIPI